MEKYIDLNRSFAQIPKDREFNEEEQELAFSFGFSGLSEKQKWNQLLQLRRVVILAEAGAGKTEEIRAATEHLRSEGKKAFFLRLEHLYFNFNTSFEIGTEVEFTQWLSLDEPAWFFLDSVDEARLGNPKNFEVAIRNFGARLCDSKERAHIFITSRLSEWRPQSDFSFVKEQLSFIELASVPEEESKDTSVDFDKTSSGKNKSTTKDDNSPIDPSVFSLLPLDKDQIRTFSQAYGVQQVDAFLDAIEKAEADIFSRRPLDLVDLINYWKEHGKIANRAKLIEFSITSKLRESDPDRDAAFPLTIEDARLGAEMIAAAVTFQKKGRILVPEQNPDPAIKTGSIDVSCVLTNWNSIGIRALLQRSIFDNAIYGTVRFHHRSVREFLTAKWLQRLLIQQKSRRAVESLFFKTLYGQKFLVPSMRPILAWLVLFDDRIREKTAEIAPEVFIQGGDPSALPCEIRKRMLKRFCEVYADQPYTDLSFDLSEVRRFAHTDLDDTINGLLDIYSGHEEIRQLLLRIVWQGELNGCSEKALAFALDSTIDVYTRVCGIRAVAVAGSNAHQEMLVKTLLADRAIQDEKIIGELIDKFAITMLTIKDVISLVKRLERSAMRIHPWIDRTLKEACLNKCSDNDIIEWIRELLPLVKQPPGIERYYYEISQRYGWLLPLSTLLAERLVTAKHPDAFDCNILEVISISQAERRYGNFNWEDHSLIELVPKWADLNRALFWFNVTATRNALERKKGERITDWWHVGFLDHFWRFTGDDYETLIEDINLKSFMDDRLVALSLAFQLYKDGGRGRTRLNKLKRAVQGITELEKALFQYLHPPKMSEQTRRYLRQEAEFKRQQKKREKEKAQNRQEWYDYLQANTQVLRDTSIATEGKIWNATSYLLNELINKHKDSNRWAVANWIDLVSEFGREVAEAYRDGCIDYWRKYQPKIRSEDIVDPHSTPHAAIVGLSGLKMESGHKSDWPKHLTEEEADLACKYAFHEMNGFPDWLQSLHSVFPCIVEERILGEIEWEFSQYNGEERCHYVLDDVHWQLDWIKPIISDRILSFLARYEPKYDSTVQQALGIVLSCSDCNRRGFIDIAKRKIKEIPTGNRRALWLAGWMCVEAEGALQTLKSILSEVTDSAQATEFSMRFIVSLIGERRERAVTEYQDFMKPEILLPLIKLMYGHIRSEEDIDRIGGGAYTPILRDHAQDGRRRLFELLLNIPGKVTYLALIDLAKHHPNEKMRALCLIHAKRRAEADTEVEPWDTRDIARFAEEAEKVPQNHRELYELAISRLLDLKADLEEGDESLAEMLMHHRMERLHRIYIGGWLRDRSNGKYNVSQEEELADRKEPDIRLHGLGFDGPVPIELKIADNCPGPELFERLNNQLCGQYLRDIRSNNGIFMIVYRGEKTKWELPVSDKKVNFITLIQFLKEEARKIVAIDSKIEAIEIIDIDLAHRNRKK
jgi:hypothetical protein